MTNFTLKSILKPSLNDSGLPVSELLELLDSNNDVVPDILKSLSIEDIQGDFINIQGAKKIVDTQKGINKRFQKDNITSSFENISISTDEKLKITFHDLTNTRLFSGLTELETTPIYSSKNDFFSWLYNMDKYANELLRQGLNNILMKNIELLKEQQISKSERKYRILVDSNEKECYLRAITSTDRYNDYDII